MERGWVKTAWLYWNALVFFCFVWFKEAFSFFIGGDDFWNYLTVPKTCQELARLFVSFQQYRPLPKALYKIYTLLPPHPPLFHIFPLLFQTVNGFLFFVLSQVVFGLQRWLAFLITLFWLASHVNFYLAFAPAAMADHLFIFFFLLSLLAFHRFLNQRRQAFFWISWAAFWGALFSKETLIVLPIVLTGLWLVSKKRPYPTFLLAFWLPTVAFYLLKLAFYKPTDSNYTYHLSPSLLVTNLKHFVLWFLNYKHGWQMGMPLPVSPFYYGAVAVYGLLVTTAAVFLFKKEPKLFFFLLTWGLAGLLPFYFLNRVLVFYLDVSLFALLLVLGVFLEKVDKAKRFSLAIVLFLLSFYFSYTIKNQWVKFSFVARGNQIAKKFYEQVVKPYDWQSHDTLCLVDLSPNAAWATAKGEEINILGKEKGVKVVVAPKENLSSACFRKRAVVLNPNLD